MAKFRNAHKGDEAFDTMTAEEIRRIRGAAEVSVTPGMEGLRSRLFTLVRDDPDEFRRVVDEGVERVKAKSMKGRRA